MSSRAITRGHRMGSKGAQRTLSILPEASAIATDESTPLVGRDHLADVSNLACCVRLR